VKREITNYVTVSVTIKERRQSARIASSLFTLHSSLFTLPNALTASIMVQVSVSFIAFSRYGLLVGEAKMPRVWQYAARTM
jgi:hypothetical protein